MSKTGFKPAWWLSNAHAQTVYPAFARRRLKPRIDYTERLELPDGDFIDLAWMTEDLSPDAPLVILLHGLGGSVNSTYVAGQFRAYRKAGFRAVLMHFRGASQTPNRLERAYHSGDTKDFEYLLDILNQREPHTKKAAVGVSLGGNVLLKWLGTIKSQSYIDAAVAISVPFQLDILATHMNQGVAKHYQKYLLKKLYACFKRKYEAYPNSMPAQFKDIEKYDSFWEFDEHITAPLHGFSSANDYYTKCSSYQYLKHIHTPTLIIHAMDDPFMTPAAIPTVEELSTHIQFELSPNGGHVGFVGGNIPGMPKYWLDERVPHFLKTQWT